MGVGRSPEGPCLGTRQLLPDGRKGDYVWKTYREVNVFLSCPLFFVLFLSQATLSISFFGVVAASTFFA